MKLPMFKIQFLDTFLYWIELNKEIGLITCGLRMPKFTMIQSVMSLFCEFKSLTKYCIHCFVNDANCCGVFLVYDGQQIHRRKEKRMCRFVCLRKSYSSQELSVMRLDM